MKPVKNHIYCPQCGKMKMQFSTRQEAGRFIQYNADEISDASGYAPVRSYFCEMCQCWHLTSHVYECHRVPQGNDHHMACYERFFSRAVSATVRLAVKEIKAKIHEINRYVFGHKGDETSGLPHCKAMYQEVCEVLEEIRDCLSRVQLNGIMKRLKAVEPYLA